MKSKLKTHNATPTEMPGEFHENASLSFIFKGSERAMLRLKKAIQEALAGEESK
jgi:hypothetical protein